MTRRNYAFSWQPKSYAFSCQKMDKHVFVKLRL